MFALLDALHPAVLAVGHGRDPDSTRRARAAAHHWEARGGQLATVVSWPPEAASWLRPASRLIADADAWLVADTPAGWCGIGPRLAETGAWAPTRTVAFSSLADPDLPRQAGRAATEGIHGAHRPSPGTTNENSAEPSTTHWEFRHGLLIRRPASRQP
ncbi:hypothetical protein [Actinomycetospora succinea]|uniref:hypothetical protein n=1 Tax=Actinomycetospora succinea TaxID=663603 RepID=UPI0031E8C8A4